MGSHRPSRRSTQQLIGPQYQHLRALLGQLRARCTTARVHDTRVAARQLRCTASALAPVLPKHSVRRLQHDLKSISEELGFARDARVRADLLLPMLRTGHPGGGNGAAEARLLSTQVRRAREHAHRTFLAHDFTRRLQHMDGAVDKLLSKGRSNRNADELVRDALLARWLKLARALDTSNPSPTDLHAIRIRAKKCRYLLDSYSDSHSQQISAWLKRLQDCLGELHDIAQARIWLDHDRTKRALRKRLRRQLGLRARSLRAQLVRLRRERPPFIL